jgi:hypothetical protein
MVEKAKTTRTEPTAAEVREPSKLDRLVLVYSRDFPIAEGRSWLLNRDRCVIGREVGEEGVHVDDELASRRHAEIIYDSELDAHTIRDLDSKNGTWVGGKRIGAAYFGSGSILRIGHTLFTFSRTDLMGSPFTPEPAPFVSFARSFAEQSAELAGPSGLPILILGPSGAGKELLVQRAHRASGREGPLVTVNCATFNRELLASELFGHVKGAFSGAGADREGLFASAHGGTLFFDEIADLALDQQPALLRALQEQRIRPVGSDRELAVDVRIIAATSRDLAELERQGSFRDDLLARLAGVRIRLPGLADRREEILDLFRRFLGVEVSLALAAAEALLLHAWPKNVRELEYAAAGARLFLAPGTKLDLALLPEEIRLAYERVSEDDPEAGEKPSRAELERLIAEHRGNVASVARALKKHREQVYRWLKQTGIDPIRYRKD